MTDLRSQRMRPVIAQLMLASLLLLTFACGPNTSRDYKRAVEDGQKTIPYAKEMIALFPGSKSFISYYTGDFGTPTWNTEVGIFGRYILTLQTKITFDATRTAIQSFEDPLFVLLEVEAFSTLGDGLTKTMYTDVQVKFGKQEWKTLVDSGGDLSTLGISVVKDKPIPGFDVHWSEN